MSTLNLKNDPKLLFGIETAEDAGVYKLTEEIALIQTVDFFTPVVNDPYYFGQIAAANSLSDIYAMGGRPITAMNIVGFPIKSLNIEILKSIIQGGLDKIHESGAVLVGGHSVDDEELKYGLSLTGIAHPDQIWSNCGARAGDKIILTKPIGLGVLNAAIKANLASEQEIKNAIRIMAHLNRTSSDAMRQTGGIHACTDITGFGLIGHLCNICNNSKVIIKLYSEQIPIIDGATRYSQMGLIPAATQANRKFYKSFVELKSEIPDFLLDLYYDPQTSGGLLICIGQTKVDNLLGTLLEKGESWSKLIGEVTGEGNKLIIL